MEKDKITIQNDPEERNTLSDMARSKNVSSPFLHTVSIGSTNEEFVFRITSDSDFDVTINATDHVGQPEGILEKASDNSASDTDLSMQQAGKA